MKKNEKKLTEIEKQLKNTPVNDTRKAFYLLSKVKNSRKIKTADICAKMGIAQSSYYRYLIDFKSQKSCSPKLSVLNKFLDALGYEIRIVDKKTENEKHN